MHIVEVCRNGKRLNISMAEMWGWLVENRMDLALFRVTMVPEGVLFRLEFKNSSDAAGFAEAFGGSNQLRALGFPG
jgi:hypothetical protein